MYVRQVHRDCWTHHDRSTEMVVWGQLFCTLPVVSLSLYSAFLSGNASQPPLQVIHDGITKNWIPIQSVTAKYWTRISSCVFWDHRGKSRCKNSDIAKQEGHRLKWPCFSCEDLRNSMYIWVIWGDDRYVLAIQVGSPVFTFLQKGYRLSGS